jgi:hypothetical protein
MAASGRSAPDHFFEEDDRASLLRHSRLPQTLEEPLVVRDPSRVVGGRHLERSELSDGRAGSTAGIGEILLKRFCASLALPVSAKADASNK